MTKSAAASTSSGALGALDAELAEALRRDERVVRDDAHPEPERPARDLLADAAEAEHAERLAGQLDAAVAPSAPSGPASARRGPAGCCATSASRSPIVCSAAETTVDSGAFATTIPRRVAASTSTLSTPDARAADHLQPLGALDQLGGRASSPSG